MADNIPGYIVKDDSEHNRTRKVMVIAFHREHWQRFLEIHKASMHFIPSLTEDDLASIIIANAIREQTAPMVVTRKEIANG